MADFEEAWVVMCRDTGTLDGDQLDVVTALRVLWTEDAARAEVERLRIDDPSDDHFYYYEATQAARRA